LTHCAPTRVRTRRKEARPAELLAAALDCFVEKGFAATRMEDIAKRAGLSKGTFYLYFPSKQAVFEALVRENLLPRLAMLETIGQLPGQGAAAGLRRLLSHIGEMAVDARLSAIPKLVLSEAGNFPDLARFYRETIVERALTLLAGLLRQGVAAGEFRPMQDPAIVARLFVAPILLTALWQSTFAAVEAQTIPPATIFATHIDLFLRSIAADPAGSDHS
jgi:AcrR family transcriptional regulator